MRTAAIAVLFAGSMWAQGRPAPANPNPYGRIMFPGTPNPGSGAAPFGRILFPGTGAPAVSRNPQANVPPKPPPQHPGHGNTVIPYPVFFGGNFLQYDPPQAQLAGQQVAGQIDPSPVVIVNQYFRPDAAPEPQSLTQAAAAAPASAPAPQLAAYQDKETYFLIAMKDHTIYAASAYWVEDGTLNYITIQGSQNSASLDLVDRETSRRLNRDRNVSFGLPNER